MPDPNTQIAPAEARTFVSAFVPDPKVIEGLDDTAVVAYHGRVSAAIDKVRPKGNGAFPDNWRQAIAGDNADELKQLERYSTPQDVWKKARALEVRLSSGELRSNLPKDATPEQTAAWRKENGVPEAPEKYELKLKDGLVIGAEDKPIVDSFLKRLHGKHVTNEQASELVNAYYDILEAEAAKGETEKAGVKQKVSDALTTKWGGDYRGNMNRIAALVDANVPITSKLKGMIQATIETNQEFAELMETFARQINPVTTLIPGAGANIANALADEINAIELKMRTDRDAYNKDEALQARYRDLLDARERIKKAA